MVELPKPVDNPPSTASSGIFSSSEAAIDGGSNICGKNRLLVTSPSSSSDLLFIPAIANDNQKAGGNGDSSITTVTDKDNADDIETIELVNETKKTMFIEV